MIIEADGRDDSFGYEVDAIANHVLQLPEDVRLKVMGELREHDMYYWSVTVAAINQIRRNALYRAPFFPERKD